MGSPSDLSRGETSRKQGEYQGDVIATTRTHLTEPFFALSAASTRTCHTLRSLRWHLRGSISHPPVQPPGRLGSHLQPGGFFVAPKKRPNVPRHFASSPREIVVLPAPSRYRPFAPGDDALGRYNGACSCFWGFPPLGVSAGEGA